VILKKDFSFCKCEEVEAGIFNLNKEILTCLTEQSFILYTFLILQSQYYNYCNIIVVPLKEKLLKWSIKPACLKFVRYDLIFSHRCHIRNR
jgi:hypothetical protein